MMKELLFCLGRADGSKVILLQRPFSVICWFLRVLVMLKNAARTSQRSLCRHNALFKGLIEA
jgi:hypothetical protein